jgi:hypothetical protein
MTLLDVVLLLVAAAAGVAGWAMGFLSRFMSWLGLVGGLVAASSVLPGLLTWLDHLDEQWLLVVAILVVVAFAMLGQALGMVAGNHLRVRLDPRWDRLDAAGGALMGVAGIVLVVWLLAPAVRTVPGWSADQVADSVVVAAIEGATPEPPDTFRTLRRIVGAEQFPGSRWGTRRRRFPSPGRRSPRRPQQWSVSGRWPAGGARTAPASSSSAASWSPTPMSSPAPPTSR